MTVSEALPDAMAAANKISDDNDWGAMDRRLVFRDNDLEWDFRVTERSRNLGQARFVLWLALGIELSFAAIDPWTLPADGMTFVLWRTIILTLALVALLGLTYAPFFRTRWPLLMTLAVHVMTVANGLTNAMVDVPVLYLAGFMLLVLASYLIVPLIFQYCIGTVTTASLVYLGITALGDVADAQLLAMLAAQLVAANVIGIAALYRAERFRRLDHLNARRLDDQRARYHDLLTSILPAAVAERLQRGETVVDEHSDVTVLFADIVGFTAMAARSRPDQILDLLNKLFAAFDEITARHGLEKIKTIGDCYMAAGGVFDHQGAHASAMADLALAMQEAAARIDDPDGQPVRIRIGIHVGGLTAGVIGQRRFMYDLWGDTVNIASRMQSLGEPDCIQVSDDLRRRLDSSYRLGPRGEIDVKGKGAMSTWYLLGRDGGINAEEDVS